MRGERLRPGRQGRGDAEGDHDQGDAADRRQGYDHDLSEKAHSTPVG